MGFPSWCNSCVYCSVGCREKGSAQIAHKQHCVAIKKLVTEIDTKIDNLFVGRNPQAVDELFSAYPDYKAYERHCLKKSGDFWQKMLDIDQVKDDYFDALERLIMELIREGWCRWEEGFGKLNRLAFRLALDQSMDLLQRRKRHYLQLHSHIYLLTGQWHELHSLCCHLARRGSEELNPEELTMMRMITNEPRTIKQHDFTKSYFLHGKGTGEIFVRYEPEWDYTCWQSLMFMFLVKWLPHIEKDNLAVIDENFLHNPDCANHIGEYTGMSKELIHYPRNYFRDQANEILHLFHIQAKYFEGGSYEYQCDEMKEFVGKCYPNGVRNRVLSALDAGAKWVDNRRTQQTLSTLMPASSLGQVIQSYEEDHRLLYATSVRPHLPWILKKINEMAGYDVLGMNVDADLSVSRLFVEADKACYTSNPNLFSDLYDDPYCDVAKSGWAEFNSINPLRDRAGQTKTNRDDFFFARYQAIMMCVMIELKLAQCHFHHRCKSERAKELLEQVPEDSYMLDPPNEDKQLGDFCGAHVELDDSDSRIRFASEWIPSVTKTVDALFAAGLATSNNLSLLFGRSDFVSYRVWTLKRQKSERSQLSMSAFVTRSRLWIEGYTEYNARHDLKIKYLSKADRRQRFEEMTTMGSVVGNSIQLMQPSFEQFVARFGWDDLELGSEEFSREYCSSCAPNETPREPLSKRAKPELDGFDSAADACRHFFDTRSLEEAVWDVLGIPRLMALDVSQEDMATAGWTRCGVKAASLGDKAVQLGQRVVHLCSGRCTVWKESGFADEYLLRYHQHSTGEK
ncbi:hypothetical protein ACHAXT_000285 [Thalassiosira profunda]